MSTAAATSQPLISAAIIVRDEAEFLQRCLGSIASWCDEIVVIDTGSTDNTVDVARSFGAVLGTFPWIGDFAAARNTALGLATGRWILYIDADEEVHPVSRQDVEAELAANNDAIALRVWFRSRPIFSPYLEYRIWKHRPDVRFVGRIHETMVPDLHRISDIEDLPIRDSDLFRLTHHGYEGDQTRKHLRNLPLLEQRVIEFPDRCYLWNHLGNIRHDLGDRDGAEAAWLRGIDLIRRRGLVDRTDVLCFGGLGLSLVERGIDPLELIDEMQTTAPWFLTQYWVAGLNHRRHGRFAESLEPLWMLVDTGADPLDDSLAYNNAMFTEWAWEALADSLIQLGDFSSAAEVFDIAHAAAPSRHDYRSRSVALAALAAKSEVTC